MATNDSTWTPATSETRWEIRPGTGPVLATAVHAGHQMRPGLLERTALSDADRLLEEDPLTDVLASVGDHVFVSWVSRFELDLNRPPEEAVYQQPSDAWGLDLWTDPLPDDEVAESLRSHTEFYDLMGDWIERLVAEHGRVLLLDVHSFNHRRDLDGEEAEAQAALPDIDLGLTTADRDRFGDVVDALWGGLREIELDGQAIDVRDNVRFPDGGNWPEWVAAHHGDSVCTVTLEYKKVFMDETTGTADISALHTLRTGLARAVEAARETLL